MIENLKRQIDECIAALGRGELTAESLNRVRGALDEMGTKHQDLLYLQTSSSALDSEVHGLMLVQYGELVEPSSPEEWPYDSALEAIRDGWHVIQFPNMALMLDESRTYGLGCEFILEKKR